MGSDKARITYDESRQYRAVVMQQGRVTVEADWNEEWQIINEELRKDLLDLIGPCGTPNDGYRVIETDDSSAPPFDFSVSKGTLYVGGMRVVLSDSLQYSQQTEWLDHLHDPDWVDLPTLQTYPKYELIYLYLREQEVSAVEDTALREVALGGPDTAQRMRLVQHIVHMSTEAQDCAGALAEARKRWTTQGLEFDPQTARLKSLATLQVNFLEEKKKLDSCGPQAYGGYLGADNQFIRVQIAGFNPQTQKYSLVWSFDNASFLYRVTVAADNKTLQLLSCPIDDFHKPRANQAVEVLRPAAQLSAITNDYIASATGSVFKLEADYVSETQSITLPEALAPEYGNIHQTPVLFLRVWEEQHDFVAGETIDLGVTGLQVKLQTEGNQPFHIGDYWLLAVRPNTSIDPNASTQLFPHRYLEGPQPPDGPRMWACSLAVIEWNDTQNENGEGRRYQLRVLEDCRNHFDNLVKLTKRKGSGCCDIIVRPEDITEQNSLQAIIDRLKDKAEATLCLQPGHYTLPSPLRIGPQHSNLTIEGCHDRVIIQAEEGQESNFLDGLIVLNRANNVTLRGLRFKLPLAPFRAIAEKLANMQIAEISRSVKALAERLFISIGIRPLHCAQLTIKDCLFRYPSTLHRDVFGIGIFANSECWGLKVHNNRFLHEEDFTQRDTERLRLLFGYILTPTSIFQSMREQKRQTPSGKLVRSLLEDAAFGENLFTNLSMAAFINADAGIVKFERNTIQECNAGFWYQAPLVATFAEELDEISVYKEQQQLARQLQNEMLAVVESPLIQIGSVLARIYPLPDEFDISHAVPIDVRHLETIGQAAQKVMQLFFDRVMAPFAKNLESKDKVPLRDIGAPPLYKPLEINKELEGFQNLHRYISVFELAVLLEAGSLHELQLSLHVANNDVNCVIPNMTTDVALLIWEDVREQPATVIISANQIHNSGRMAAEIFMIERCTITGNIIINDDYNYNESITSLLLIPRALMDREGTIGVAVTGNVLQGRSNLNQLSRPKVPVPLDTWVFFNTEI